MATEKAEGKAVGKEEAKRHPYGPRPIGALVPGITRPAFRTRAPAAAQVMADWREIVGPVLAEATAPRRLSGGTLTLACSGPMALELQHLATELIGRINGHLGRRLIERLRFVQEAPGSLGGSLPGPVARRSGPVEPVEVPGFPAGPLRDALGTLGARLGARRKPDRA